MTDNEVTVLVATRNRPGDVKRCLESILASSYPRFRLIVVDQSEGDQTRLACTAMKDERLSYMKDAGTGLSRARNLGIAAIPGGIVAMTDDDCVVAGDWLERVVELFERNSDCMLAFGNFVAAPHDWRTEFVPSAVFEREATHPGREHRFSTRGCGGNMAARRVLFSRVGGFDERLGAGASFHSSEDFDMMYRTCSAGLLVIDSPSAQVEHWGARSLTNGDAQRLQRNTALGDGARLAKAWRCGDWRAAGVVADEVLARMSSATSDLAAGRRPKSASHLPYLLWGFLQGMVVPLCRTGRVFREEQRTSAGIHPGDPTCTRSHGDPKDLAEARRLPRRPRVLLVCPSGTIGGMERVVIRLARQLATLGWDPSVVFASGEHDEAFVRWAQGQGVVAEPSAAVQRYDQPRSLADMLAFARMVRRYKPDIVNLHYGGGHMAAKDVGVIRLATRAACVVNVHLPVPWTEAGRKKKVLTRLAARWSAGAVAHSNSIRELLVSAGIAADRVTVIPNGGQSPESEHSKQDSRTALGIPLSVFAVGCLARMAPVKRQADLIEAVALMGAVVPTAFLVLAGDGPDRPALEALASTRLPGRHVFLGELNGTPDQFFSAIDVFALSSTVEGLPMVYIEAALRGVAVVGTDVGGAAEIVLNEQTGLLVSPRTPTAMADALLRLHDNPDLSSQLGCNALERARAEFTEGLMGARYDTLFMSHIRHTSNA